MQLRLFKPTTILYNGIIPLTTTRFPWLHKNFSGILGWKQGYIKELEDKSDVEPEHRGNLKVLFKAFGSVVMLDSDKSEFWKLPKITVSSISIRAGWLYWAIIILKGHIYYIPPEVEAEYKLLSDEDNLHTILKLGMNSGNPKMIMYAMDVMLKLNYSHFTIHINVVSKSGDSIKYRVSYPSNRVIIESVNGIQNQVLCAKYHHLLTSGDHPDRIRGLLHKDHMTSEQLEWLSEVD